MVGWTSFLNLATRLVYRHSKLKTRIRGQQTRSLPRTYGLPVNGLGQVALNKGGAPSGNRIPNFKVHSYQSLSTPWSLRALWLSTPGFVPNSTEAHVIPSPHRCRCTSRVLPRRRIGRYQKKELLAFPLLFPSLVWYASWGAILLDVHGIG